MSPNTTSRSVYTVDWSGQGYEQLINQMREMLAMKRQLDTAFKQGVGSPAGRAEQVRQMRSTGVTGAGGGVVAGPQLPAEKSRAAQAVRDLQQERRTTERAQKQAERDQQQAAREAQRTARAQAQAQRQAKAETRRVQSDAAKVANATPNVFKDFAGPLPTTDAGWLARQKQMVTVQEEALRTGKDLNTADRKLFGATNNVSALLQRRQAIEEGKSPLSRAVNFAGWMMPGQAYYAQMAFGEAGLGLPLPFMAAGIGAAGLVAGGVAINNTLASQTAMAEMLAGISNTGGGSISGPADQAFGKLIANNALAFNVDRGQANQLLPVIGGYNITNKQDIANVLTGGLTRANVGQLTNQQGVQLQSMVAGRMFGGNSTQAIAEFAKLDDAIQRTGANAHATYQDILALGDTLTPGTNLTQFAQIEAGLAGTGTTIAQTFGGTLSAFGTQRQTAALMMQAYGGIPANVDAEAYYRNMQQNNPTALALAEKQTLQNVLKSTNGNVSLAQAIVGPAFGITDNTAWNAALNFTPPAYATPKQTISQWVNQGLADQGKAGGAVLSETPLQNLLGPQLGQRVSDTAANAWQWAQQNPELARLAGGAGVLGVAGVLGTMLGPANANETIGTLTNVLSAIQPATGTAEHVIHNIIDINLKDAAGNLLKTIEVRGSTTLTNTATAPGPGVPPNIDQKALDTASQSSTSGGHL